MRYPKKGRTVLCKGTRVKYRFINDHRHQYRTMVFCQVPGVSRSGFYQWLQKPLSDCAIDDQRLLLMICGSYAASSGVYGAPRVFLGRGEAGETCGKNWVVRIMGVNKIKALCGRKSPRVIAGRPSIIAPNRLKGEFTVDWADNA